MDKYEIGLVIDLRNSCYKVYYIDSLIAEAQWIDFYRIPIKNEPTFSVSIGAFEKSLELGVYKELKK